MAEYSTSLPSRVSSWRALYQLFLDHKTIREGVDTVWFYDRWDNRAETRRSLKPIDATRTDEKHLYSVRFIKEQVFQELWQLQNEKPVFSYEEYNLLRYAVRAFPATRTDEEMQALDSKLQRLQKQLIKAQESGKIY